MKSKKKGRRDQTLKPIADDVATNPLTKLRVESGGMIELLCAAEFLRALDNAYNSIYTADLMMPLLQRRTEASGMFVAREGRVLSTLIDPPDWATVVSALSLSGSRRFVPSRDRLVLKSVEIHSPGFWEFIGKLNPLEVIRLSINDAHERHKDRKYRESAEKRMLELENALRESRLLKERVEIAKAMGATKADLKAMLDRFVYQPLLTVRDKSDRAGVHNAKIEDFERE